MFDHFLRSVESQKEHKVEKKLNPARKKLKGCLLLTECLVVLSRVYRKSGHFVWGFAKRSGAFTHLSIDFGIQTIKRSPSLGEMDNRQTQNACYAAATVQMPSLQPLWDHGVLGILFCSQTVALNTEVFGATNWPFIFTPKTNTCTCGMMKFEICNFLPTTFWRLVPMASESQTVMVTVFAVLVAVGAFPARVAGESQKRAQEDAQLLQVTGFSGWKITFFGCLFGHWFEMSCETTFNPVTSQFFGPAMTFSGAVQSAGQEDSRSI